jgi:hypothetical protein
MLPSTRCAEQQASSQSRHQFQFISVSGTHLRGDEDTRRRVRSHAQADYRRRVKRSTLPALPAPLPSIAPATDLSAFAATWRPSDPSLHSSNNGYSSGLGAFDTSSVPESLALAPTSPREALREDVYGLLPGNRLRRSQLLWDHCTVFFFFFLCCWLAYLAWFAPLCKLGRMKL